MNFGTNQQQEGSYGYNSQQGVGSSCPIPGRPHGGGRHHGAATVADVLGRKRKMTEEELHEHMERIARSKSGNR